MARHAADIVALVRQIDGAELDYSVRSLEIVDRVLWQFHDAGDDAPRMAETVFRFGAYIGEVVVHTAGGSWVMLPDEHPLGGAGWPMVQLGPEWFVNPVGKAFKRVDNGASDSIGYFYRALVER